MNTHIEIPMEQINAFCMRWHIVEFSLFGSVLRKDFRPESDVDVLVTFEPNAQWSLYDWVDMIDELSAMFGRKVDLVEKTSLRNPFRRREILDTCEVLYAA